MIRSLTRSVRSFTHSVMHALDRFFFHAAEPYAVGMFRIMFTITMLINVLLRIPHTEFYFTEAGGVWAKDAPELLPEFHRTFFSFHPGTYAEAITMQVVLVVALVMLLIGLWGRIGSRITAIIAFVCHVGLMQRNYSIVYGADIVATFWLFGMCLMNTGEALSLRSYFRKSKIWLEPVWSRTLSSVGLRISQIQLCVIYSFTGFEKLKGGDWWDQTAIWKVLGNEQLMTADLSFLRAVPLVIGLATWGTVLFEVYAPVLFWVKSTRKWVILAGWALHVGIAATMGLYIFSLTMLSAYFLFFDTGQVRSLLRRIGVNRIAT